MTGARPWDAEHGVDAALAARLVHATWPDLADHRPVHVGSGWDVDVWRFGELCVRFPRRAFGIQCVDNELAVLPALPALPIPCPRVERVGTPTLGYPSRFYAHRWLPGVPVLRAELSDDALAGLAAPLGTFLAALHRLPLAPLRARGLARDGRGDASVVADRGRTRLAELVTAGMLDGGLAQRAEAVLATATPTQERQVVVHGDFHAGNLLVETGRPSAVIDWGDCSAGDPAIDLAAGWSVVPPAARSAFLAAYEGVPERVWRRARVHAVSRQGLALLAWGAGLGDATIVRWATVSLQRMLAETEN